MGAPCRKQLWQWMEEGCRKLVFGVCPTGSPQENGEGVGGEGQGQGWGGGYKNTKNRHTEKQRKTERISRQKKMMKATKTSRLGAR